MQQHRLSFNDQGLDDLESFDAPALGNSERASDHKPDEPTDGRLNFDSDLEEMVEKFLVRQQVMERGAIKVEFKRADELELGGDQRKGTHLNFREFLHKHMPDSTLPPDFGEYVSQSIGAINGCFESTYNDKSICNNSPYERVGIVVRCDLDECRFTVPNTDAALGHDTIRGGGPLAGPFSDATLLIIGIPENIDVNEYLSENKGNYRNHFSQIADNINSPVLVYGTTSNNTSGNHHFSVNHSAAIVQPNGRIDHFTPGQ